MGRSFFMPFFRNFELYLINFNDIIFPINIGVRYMKKIIAAALSILVGAFGYTIAEETIDSRVATLESECSSLYNAVSSLAELHNTVRVTGPALTTTPPQTNKPFETTTPPQTTIPSETTTTALNVDGGYCGDYATWKFENGTLIISGIGEMYDYPDWWNDYEYEIKNIIIENGITSIGRAAFYHFTNLTSVSLPDSLTNIGITAFSDCTKLSYITIPSNVTNIGWGAFYKCSSLKNIIIPNGITIINTETFYGCTSLTNITIPDSVLEIHSSAFSGCANLTNVSIGNNVKSIGENCFYNSTNLKTVYIGSDVMTVGEMAFAGCVNITDVYYAGTQEQWNTITFEASNARLTDATIHFEN